MNEKLRMRYPTSFLDWSLFTGGCSLKELERYYQHSKALTILLGLVFMMRKMSSGQSSEVPVGYLIPRAPSVMDYNFMHGYIGYAIQKDSQSDVESEVKSGHDPELHVQPTWNGKDQGKPIVLLKGRIGWVVMVFVQRPSKGVHHIFMGKPRHKLHGPEGSNNDGYVNYDLHQSFPCSSA
jgi:hypothetical protein